METKKIEWSGQRGIIGDYIIKLRKKDIPEEGLSRIEYEEYPFAWYVHVNKLGKPFMDLLGADEVPIYKINKWVEDQFKQFISDITA